jgi:hypothetical protein
MGNRFQRRALRRGACIMGSEARLRDLLGAPPGAFLRWLEGDEAMPEPALGMLLELLSAMESRETLPPR